jgi:D-glycero-alpha-D-manno-heptose-7-phosphate kinase
MSAEPVIRSIHSAAPIRICDCGGFTDTWFAKTGEIFNIAVEPCVQVQLRQFITGASGQKVAVRLENSGQQYVLGDASPRQDALVNAAVVSASLPANIDLEISIYSAAPSGSSTGTSAAVCVALLAGLERLSGKAMFPHEIARAAHRVETEKLRLQSGIQDQLAAAYGGVNYIEMHGYPDATITRLSICPALRWELESRLAVIYIGQAHNSSKVHEAVIATAEGSSPDSAPLCALRRAAENARDAVLAGDLSALGGAMIANTDAQASLHESIVGEHHRRIIDIARRNGMCGWKVNGAGGDGGSVAILGTENHALLRSTVAEILAAGQNYSALPVRLCESGVRTWEQPRTA